MEKKKQKVSVSEKIMKVLKESPNDAEGIKRELKDTMGFKVEPSDIRVNLLYLLRRGKIKRKKEGKIYKYYI